MPLSGTAKNRVAPMRMWRHDRELRCVTLESCSGASSSDVDMGACHLADVPDTPCSTAPEQPLLSTRCTDMKAVSSPRSNPERGARDCRSSMIQQYGWEVTCASRAQLQVHADDGYVCSVQNLGPVPQNHGPELWGGRQEIDPPLLPSPCALRIHPAPKRLAYPVLRICRSYPHPVRHACVLKPSMFPSVLRM